MYMHIPGFLSRRTAIWIGTGVAALLAYPLLASSDRAQPQSSVRVLEVAAAPARALASYSVERSYVGRIESARRSDLGFELAGLIRQIVSDEGDPVTAGQVVAVLDTARLRARRSELASARDRAHAELELSELTVARHKVLVDEDVISPQRWDETRLLRDARLADLARFESEIATLDVDLEKSILRAPFAGEVARRYVDEGSVVDAGTAVLRVLETTHLEARVGVAKADAEAIAVGTEHALRVSGREITGRVRSILPERGRETRAVELILRVGAQPDLQDGDLVELVIRSDVTARGFWLPMTALSEGSRGLWSCYVAEPLGEAEGPATHRLARRQLEVLHEESDRVYARGTLRDGEQLVIEGSQRLVPGQRVRLVAEEG